MGTKMSLHRFSPAVKDWDETLHVIDQVFIDAEGTVDVVLPTNYIYEPDKGLLKVYYNGQRILNGGQYKEIDDRHIELSFGEDLDGNPYEIGVGDEIYIEVHKNEYCSRGPATISSTQFYDMQAEIRDARQYTENDKLYNTLDDRLDAIQNQLAKAGGGAADHDVIFTHNTEGQIVKEEVTGRLPQIRELEYYGNEEPLMRGELSRETLYLPDDIGDMVKSSIKEYTYTPSLNPRERRILRTTVRKVP